MGQSPPRPFGPLLRAHRHTAGLTLDELSAASGVTARAVGDMERGHSRGPQARTVQALADALRLDPAARDALLAAARAGRRRRTVPGGLCALPMGTPDFAGRTEELRVLREGSGGADGGVVLVVHGAPGLGKTALVAQAAREVSARHTGGCLFLDLRGLDPEPLTPYDAQARLLRALGVSDGDLPTGADDRAALYRATVDAADVLLVLDNAADASQVLPLLPTPGTGPVWVTSRRALTALPAARRLPLAPLPTETATHLLAEITAGRTTAPPYGDALALAGEGPGEGLPPVEGTSRGDSPADLRSAVEPGAGVDLASPAEPGAGADLASPVEPGAGADLSSPAEAASPGSPTRGGEPPRSGEPTRDVEPTPGADPTRDVELSSGGEPAPTLAPGAVPASGADPSPGVPAAPRTQPAPGSAPAPAPAPGDDDDVDPGDPEERAALARIAELCGGLPLALRIAGNRLVTRPGWTASALADRLAAEDHRLARLTAGDLAVRSAFSLSYEQLTDPARALFRRLALVTGADFTPVLGAVLTGSPLERVEELTDELVELGLLGHDAAGRASFHDLLRLYARRTLEAEETPEARRAAEATLRAWLLRTARTAGRRFEPGEDTRPADSDPLVDVGDRNAAQLWLREEHTHWLTALREAAAAGEHATVVDVAESMHWFSDRWPFWGHWHEVFALSRDAARALGDLTAEATHANYLSWAHFHCRHDPATGAGLALEAAALAERAGDTEQEAWAYTYAAHTAVTLARYEPAVTYARRAAALFEAEGSREGLPTALVTLARSLRSIGRYEEAVHTLDRLLALLADPATAPAPHIADYSTMNALCGKALALLELRRWDDARRAAERALEVDFRVGVPVLRGQALLCRARALAGLGQRADALTAAREALEAARIAGHTTQRAEAEELIARWEPPTT
ncbi:helix-turn-helix domain-containing protein [Streptomyces sp. NPDC101249]|uniref:helix-turn-helix domain-containing protein n=1 Tax=Streptomyces sp. NPDC101249 TaxID=3366140 RepID=UPI0038070E27